MRKRKKEIEISDEFLEDIKYKDKNSYLILNLIHPDTDFNGYVTDAYLSSIPNTVGWYETKVTLTAIANR